MSTLTIELKELINKQLPGLHAEALKEFIEEAEKNKKVIEKQKQDYDKLNEIYLKICKEVERLKELDVEHRDILARRGKLNEESKILELDKLKFETTKQLQELRALEAEKRSVEIYNLTSILFQNERTVQKIMESKHKFIQGYNSGNNYVAPHSEDENYNYTKEELTDKDTTKLK